MASDATPQTKKVKSRSHHGCSNCRKSRLKCDERKPVCTRCWQKDLPCTPDTTLKWESDFHSRGLAFGRTGVWSKGSSPKSGRTVDQNVYSAYPAIESWSFLHGDFATLKRLYEADQLGTEPRVVDRIDRFATQGPQRSLALFPELDGLGNSLFFDYYIKHICPRTISSLKSQSPFATVLLPYCASASPTVLKAIQALAACHWSQTNSTHQAVGLRLKNQVLNDLRHMINNTAFVLSADPEVLVVIMMLCMYEIVDHCDKRWIVHMQGAKDIIRLRRQRLISSTEHPVSSFAERFFAFQDVMGRTACAKADLFGPSYWRDNDQSIDQWMGCSPELVSILFSIMDLSKARRELVSDSDQVTFNIKASLLNQRLGNLVQEPDDAEDETLRTVAELKHLACRVYLNCALYNARPSTSLIKDHVRKILKTVFMFLEQGLVVNVMWPIFVAAVELDPLDDELWSDETTGTPTYGRALVLRALDVMTKSSVSSVSRTRAVINKVWQARDFDLMKSSDKGSSCALGYNDWEWYVVPVSDALSLA
ncbi:C6 zinc finger domain protein [Aspergillus steynii IBT 23096]|uniref:C6 zinc finger domain protein n=1 Tax=Aspergillus steynii IBT 23096 TaxID=1392250 RepID=A0A2I2GLW9_9EURO|nr:C6 zinc finger domain protein [Aspergillus steynii IBT 23096]PLB53870.1 C6 zinc finger domain protein [Aspergillus steynii IBT 23096]